MSVEPKRPRSLYVLVATLALQGLSGVGGGSGLVADPTGEALGLPLGWLEGSLFSDYLIPGVVLLLVLGIGPLVVAAGVWSGSRWAWGASLLVGMALLVWIAVEIAVIGYQPRPPLQLVYGVLGGLIVGLVLAPSVRTALATRRKSRTTATGSAASDPGRTPRS